MEKAVQRSRKSDLILSAKKNSRSAKEIPDEALDEAPDVGDQEDEEAESS